MGDTNSTGKSALGEYSGEERKFQKDFPARVYEASKRLDDKEKNVAIQFTKDIERYKVALSGYTDLTDSLDKVKKSLDQVTHLLTEKV